MKDASADEPCSGQKRRDAHDWATLIVLTLTLIAAGCAATFTGIQAWIGRDQERRTLRAYIVAEPSLKGSFADPSSLFAMITSENMGQTPVYDLMAFIVTDVKPFEAPLSIPDEISTDCAYVYSHNESHGSTFRKNRTDGRGISTQTTVDMRQGLQKGDVRLYVYGTICYKDIFHEAHHVRLCFYWISDDRDPEICPYEDVSSD